MPEDNEKQTSSELLNHQVATNIRWLHRLIDYYRSKGQTAKAEEILQALRIQSQSYEDSETI